MMNLNIKILSIVLSTFLSQNVYADACVNDNRQSEEQCSPEKLREHQTKLNEAAAAIEANRPGAAGAAEAAYNSALASQTSLNAQRAACNEVRNRCIQSCLTAVTTHRAVRPVPEEVQAQEDTQRENQCRQEHAQTEQAAQQASMDMGKAMEALMAMMQMLGMNKDDTKQAEPPLCTREPNNPQCKTDVAAVTSGGDFTTGAFRNDTSGRSTDGDLGSENLPEVGPAPAQAGGGGGGAMGAAGMPLGGGGGVPSGLGRPGGGEKSAEFDGSPKINMASGFANAGGGGAPGGRGGGQGSKGTANPGAGRTSLDGEGQALKIAQAAEDRLRNPASASEPMGGITSVYYLDNFTKVEKRITNERNTLQEH